MQQPKEEESKKTTMQINSLHEMSARSVDSNDNSKVRISEGTCSNAYRGTAKYSNVFNSSKPAGNLDIVGSIDRNALSLAGEMTTATRDSYMAA